MKRLFLVLFLVCLVAVFSFLTGGEINQEGGKFTQEAAEYKGYVTLWFDDGLLSTYEIAYPILEEKGWKGTLALVGDREIAQEKFIPDGDPIMSWEQAKELADAGWEISSHSMTHSQLNSITDQAILESEIVDSKNHLEDIGFIVESFTFPYGQNGKDPGQSLINKNYQYWRSSTSGLNPLPAWRHVTAEFLTTGTSQQDVREWIREAEESKSWLVICFHAIVDSPINEWQHTKKQFSMVIKEIEQSNLKVILPHEIFEKFGYAEDYLTQN
jgi:peptidoglycan/xylan/chitin deacetylase (PgdA/CDA1 family)